MRVGVLDKSLFLTQLKAGANLGFDHHPTKFGLRGRLGKPLKLVLVKVWIFSNQPPPRNPFSEKIMLIFCFRLF